MYGDEPFLPLIDVIRIKLLSREFDGKRKKRSRHALVTRVFTRIGVDGEGDGGGLGDIDAADDALHLRLLEGRTNTKADDCVAKRRKRRSITRVLPGDIAGRVSGASCASHRACDLFRIWIS